MNYTSVWKSRKVILDTCKSRLVPHSAETPLSAWARSSIWQDYYGVIMSAMASQITGLTIATRKMFPFDDVIMTFTFTFENWHWWQTAYILVTVRIWQYTSLLPHIGIGFYGRVIYDIAAGDGYWFQISRISANPVRNNENTFFDLPI